jgi:RHS repeat-associated protein
MTLPGRTFAAALPSFGGAGGGYRYGFNGKEKDNSTGEGNLDFGARILDVRIGRWLSVDPLYNVYPFVSPYNFALNNPLNNIDSDGNILRDKDGNIIITSTGSKTSSQYTISTDMVNGNLVTKTLKAEYEIVTVYTDKGTPINALLLIKEYIEVKETKDPGNPLLENTTTTSEKVDNNLYGAASDCHGFTFTGSKVWINDHDNFIDIFTKNPTANPTVEKILNDEYIRNVDEKAATAVIYKKNGGIVHSAIKNSSGGYDNDAGIMVTEKGKTMEGASRNLTDVTNPKNVEYVKRNGDDRILNTNLGTFSNGLRKIDFNIDANIETFFKELSSKNNNTPTQTGTSTNTGANKSSKTQQAKSQSKKNPTPSTKTVKKIGKKA